jgi:hypothetical protein
MGDEERGDFAFWGRLGLLITFLVRKKSLFEAAGIQANQEFRK